MAPHSSAAAHHCNFACTFCQAEWGHRFHPQAGLGDVDLPHASLASHARSSFDGSSEFDIFCAFVSAGNFGRHRSLLDFLV